MCVNKFIMWCLYMFIGGENITVGLTIYKIVNKKSLNQTEILVRESFLGWAKNLLTFFSMFCLYRCM